MRSLRLTCCLAGAVAVTGCAGVPDSGSLHLGRPVEAAGGGLTDAVVREVPAGPQPGASPVALVTGFLRAMVDSDAGYGVARSYLAPGATWNANADITVYAGSAHVVRSGSGVVVSARRTGVIGPRGSYRVDPGTVTRRVQLTHRGGEWRISHISPGVLLSSDDAERVLQPAVVYFLTPDGRRVVPEPVLEPPQEPGLATTLMRALIGGPGPVVAPGVRTAIPRGTSLLGNVPISTDGVAEVDLSASARQVTPAQLPRLSAQIVWTLRQLNSVTAVRILVNGDALTAPGVPALQAARAWPQFDPAVPPTSTGSLLVRAGQVIGAGVDVPRALRAPGFTQPVRSADGSVVAALRHRGTELVVGPAAGPMTPRLRDANLTRPSFGPDGATLIAGASGVHLVPRSGHPRDVRLPESLAGQTVRAIAVSRDGTRVALVTGRGALRIATLAMVSGGPELLASRVLLPASTEASGVAWAGADQIITTVGGPDGRRSVIQVGLDGYLEESLSAPGLPRDVDDVAASPGQYVLASSPAGTWRLVGNRWGRVSAGVEPSYAGG